MQAPGLTVQACYILFYLNSDYADDDHRISLMPLPNFPECQNNYINASYIDVCKHINIL